MLDHQSAGTVLADATPAIRSELVEALEPERLARIAKAQRLMQEQDIDAILLLVEGPWNKLARLEDQVEELEGRLELTISTKRTEERRAEANLLPYAVDVVALDHPGIVYNLASFFSQRGINIEDMTTAFRQPFNVGPV